MKKIQYSFIILLVSFVFGLNLNAQVDSRNRTVETIIVDGLGQLPTQNAKKYNEVISEFAATGEKGLLLLAEKMVPADKGENSKYEYAINSTVDYVMAPGNEKYRSAIVSGLVKALDKCTDNPNKSFLMSELQKCATANEFGVFEKYLGDSYLQDFAISGIAKLPGVDNKVVELINAEKAPKDKLAYLAYFKKLNGVEDKLLSWLPGADEKTTTAIYNALTVCGSDKSAKVLAAASKKVGYDDDATGATDSYLQLLNNLSDAKTVTAAGKAFSKVTKPGFRAAGLRLMMKSAGSKAPSVILNALKDKDIQYRNTALDFAKEYAGEGIFSTVASKFKSLSPEAQTDVVRWLGNNGKKEFTDVVLSAVTSSNDELASAAMASASRLGGEKALAAIAGQLGGKNADAAKNALLSYNGNITSGILPLLASNDANTVKAALDLASTRRMSGAYDKVVELTKSSDASIKDAAIDALKGVVKPNNFNDVCSMLESASGANVAKLQEAAKGAIYAETPAEQFKAISSRLQGSSNPSVYYPLLAQAGNSESIAKLVEEYKNGSKKDDAFKSLLKVDNPEMIDILYDLAQSNASQKDAILGRYLDLAKVSANNDVAKYQLYSKALSLNPSDKVQSKLVSALGDTKTLPALMLMSKYLDNNATSAAAADAVKLIVSKNADLQNGETTKSLLTKAQDIYKAQKAGGNADAGYAVDEITGILSKMNANGYKNTNIKGSNVNLGDKLENFEFYMDWKGAGKLQLRSMPAINLCDKEGVSMAFGDSKKVAAKKGEWNTLYVKVVNDRVMVQNNGETLVENATLKNTPDTKAINTTGKVAVEPAAEIGFEAQNVYLNELPATPVFTLPADEAKQGFEVLFDGRSLENWQGNTTGYVPVDGNIFVTANYGGTGNLYTKKRYSDFVYRFEFCFVTPGVNNGVGIRTEMGVDAAYEGMEIQILDHENPIYKGLNPYQQHGSVYGVIIPERVHFEVGKWNTEEIRAEGDNITVTVNGKVILKGNIREACQGHNVKPAGETKNPYTLDHKDHPGLFNKDGYISFCGHGPGVKFRNIRVLDLSKKSAKKSSKKRK